MSCQDLIKCEKCGSYRVKQKPTQEYVCLDCRHEWKE